MSGGQARASHEGDALASSIQPIHVAFVWHMHQPYYRSAKTGSFQMPWARLHAVKDYLDMVEILADYPSVHQTFNLVPSLIEQLEDYATGGLPETLGEMREAAARAAGRNGPLAGAVAGNTGRLSRAGSFAAGHPSSPAARAMPVSDVYWEHTLKPAVDLDPGERAFVVERMCEHPDHPRARSHRRYLELALKREAQSCRGWEACAAAFTADELRDIQVWFNLAWYDPTLLESEPLQSLVRRGRNFTEEDKRLLAHVQNDVLRRVIPAYREAADAGRLELTTSPYFHPILPLLANTDSARVGAGDTILPSRRFAHPEDAWEQVERGVAKHKQVFGLEPRGMWCSEQSVGEDVLPLLMRAGIRWTISDQVVLSRSLAGSAPAPAGPGAGDGQMVPAGSPYQPYLLTREEGELAIVFRDHTLSDLIGFGYQSWNSKDAAADLLNRIRAIGTSIAREAGLSGDPLTRPPLVTIALDGENAWEYYPNDGRDFLHFLYEGLAADPALRCVTISEHLEEFPATAPLGWLHTGSWIGGDLRTWSGDPGHNAAWDLLHDARDVAAFHRRRPVTSVSPVEAGETAAQGMPGEATSADASEEAWRHIMVAEGSDWFWWFGEHHHTELDYVWDLEFRQHLQEVYRCLGETTPIRLYLPVFAAAADTGPVLPGEVIRPVIDGRLSPEDGWGKAGILPPDKQSTMQRTEGARLVEARFGWGEENLYLLLVPRDRSDLEGLEIDLTLAPASFEDETIFHMTVGEDGRVDTSCLRPGRLPGTASAAWGDVLEIEVPLSQPILSGKEPLALMLRAGRGGMVDRVFRSAGLTPPIT